MSFCTVQKRSQIMFKKYIGGKIIKSVSRDDLSVSVMDAKVNECEL